MLIGQRKGLHVIRLAENYSNELTEHKIGWGILYGQWHTCTGIPVSTLKSPLFASLLQLVIDALYISAIENKW